MVGGKVKVLNKATDTLTDNSVYIGRPSKWGNPFISGIDGTKAEVIAKFKQHLYSSPELMASLHELVGKDLVCWCKPKACHGDVLLQAVKEYLREDLIIY